MTGKTLRKFNIYRHPEKSPGHKNGKDRVPSTIFSATRFVHFLRLCMLELPLPPSNQHYFIFGKSQPQKNPSSTLVTVTPGYRPEKTPFSVLHGPYVSEASWVEGCSAMMLEITSCKVGVPRCDPMERC